MLTTLLVKSSSQTSSLPPRPGLGLVLRMGKGGATQGQCGILLQKERVGLSTNFKILYSSFQFPHHQVWQVPLIQSLPLVFSSCYVWACCFWAKGSEDSQKCLKHSSNPVQDFKETPCGYQLNVNAIFRRRESQNIWRKLKILQNSEKWTPSNQVIHF